MIDDFSKQIIEVLAKRVGNRCSNPSCRKLTSGPHEDPSRALNIGVGAHITAASSGGPRYDQSINSEERQSPQNGIWLCQNCAKLIDNDVNKYNTMLLYDWKSRAEAHALSEVEGHNHKVEINPESSTEISISYKNMKIESRRHDYLLMIELTNRSSVPLENYHIDVVIPSVLMENPEKHPFIVKDRSTNKQSLFRFVNDKRLRSVMPGDISIVMTFDYRITQEIYFNRGDLLYKQVTATLYHYGFQSLTVEKAVEDLQVF